MVSLAAERDLLRMRIDFMTVQEATKLIHACAEQMNARYHDVVFDEWAVVSLQQEKGRLMDYHGPRKERFQKEFPTDSRALQEGLLTGRLGCGDFEFAREGVGTAFEAFMVMGEGVFLICNNTVQSMDGIASNPRWLGAQVAFVELSDRFRADPVSVA